MMFYFPLQYEKKTDLAGWIDAFHPSPPIPSHPHSQLSQTIRGRELCPSCILHLSMRHYEEILVFLWDFNGDSMGFNGIY